jgi:Amt family ammonium transporter
VINPSGADGLIYGNVRQLGIQALGVAATIIFAAVVTFAIAKALDAIMGLRVSEEEEAMGLDNTQHRESAYTLID